MKFSFSPAVRQCSITEMRREWSEVVAINRDHQRETDRGLGGGDCHHEDDEDLPGGPVETGEGDEAQVHGVEHQLEGHVDDDEVATCEDPEQPEAEQEGAHDEIMVEAGSHGLGVADSVGSLRVTRSPSC